MNLRRTERALAGAMAACQKALDSCPDPETQRLLSLVNDNLEALASAVLSNGHTGSRQFEAAVLEEKEQLE